MGWSIGYDPKWERDIGYAVPATCDHPRCMAEIDRGLAHVCGSDPFGGERGCGLYFCYDHLALRKPRGEDRYVQFCRRCWRYDKPFPAKPDIQEWIDWKLTDESWAQWRSENPDWVAAHSTATNPEGAPA